MKPDVPRSQFDALVLAAIECSPAHGYEIIRRIRLRSADVFSLPEGTVYPALHRLERDGLVKGHWENEGRRKRRTYRVTRAGVEALAVRRLEWKTYSRAVNAVLV